MSARYGGVRGPMTTTEILAGLVQAEHVLRLLHQNHAADACAAAWEKLTAVRP